MFMRSNRVLFGGIIAWLAGFSYTVALLPFLLQLLSQVMPVTLNVNMRQYLAPLTLAWIPVGMVAANMSTARRGGLVLGIGGAVLGAITGAIAGGGLEQWWIAVLSALVAGLYAAGAGMLMAGGFADSPRQDGGNGGS